MPINTVSHWARWNLIFLFQPFSLLLVRVGGGCIAYPTFDWLSYHLSKFVSGFNYFSYFVIASGFLLISPVWEGLHEQISTSTLKLNLFFKDKWSKGSSRSTSLTVLSAEKVFAVFLTMFFLSFHIFVTLLSLWQWLFPHTIRCLDNYFYLLKNKIIYKVHTWLIFDEC